MVAEHVQNLELQQKILRRQLDNDIRMFNRDLVNK